MECSKLVATALVIALAIAGTGHSEAAPAFCDATLPGSTEIDATISFPGAYGGYPASVNNVELLPLGADLQGFIASGSTNEAYIQPALHTGATQVSGKLCAPTGATYWLAVDSGFQRVVIGQVRLGPGTGPFRQSFVAPPLGSVPTSPPPGPPAPELQIPGPQVPVSVPTTPVAPPPATTSACNPNIPAYSQPGCAAGGSVSPQPTPVARPPVTTSACNPNIPAYAQPGCSTAGSAPAPYVPPPSATGRCNPDVPRYAQPGCTP
jgi:hypothetical protein